MAGESTAAVWRQQRIAPLLLVAVILGIVALPIAVWLDLRALSDRLIRLQAAETSRIIDDMRIYYADSVVARVVAAKGGTVAPTQHFQSTSGGIPIPETLSIELGHLISARDGNVKYRFVSDLPFRGREDHHMDGFEKTALKQLRAEPKREISEVSGSIFDRQIRAVTPVLMAKVCVDCHNAHPDSPKRDWKVGDVRGIQELTVRQPINANVFAFKYTLTYLVLGALTGLAFIMQQRRQAQLVSGMNDALVSANSFLATISMKIGKYLPPQIHQSIFSGEKDVVIATERKKLTIFFSDIKDFTETTEGMQPEDLTAILNEYFTAMSAIAEAHGGTVDKFIGDAMVIFFGDPGTKGVEADARSCVAMAAEMQQRLERLNLEWRERGIEKPFQTRIGITTGYCNVGNFGSDDRMQYTIIGAEVNLAARLQSIAEPGKIVLSYETHALVCDMVDTRQMEPISIKGISHDVVAYVVEELSLGPKAPVNIIAEHAVGLDLVLDIDALDASGTERARQRLSEALHALDRSTSAAPRSAS